MRGPLPEGFDADAAGDSEGGIYGLPTKVEDARVVVIPVPFEVTVSYGDGTANGPAAILAASRQVDLFDAQVGKPYERGIAMLDIPAEIRQWSDDGRKTAARLMSSHAGASPEDLLLLKTVDAFSTGMNLWVRKTVREHLDAGRIAVVLGGDHSVPFGAFEAYAAKYPGLGILHFDAHYDLRRAYGGFTWSHASIMYNALARIPDIATIVHVGIRDFCEAEARTSAEFGERSITYGDLALRDRLASGEPWRKITDEIANRLPDKVYVSFDIDGLDPALCPGTGTPVPGGLSFYEATSLIEAVVRSGRTVVGADLVEVAPADGDDEWNANVGARMLYKLIGFCVQS